MPAGWKAGLWARTILPREQPLVEAIKADILSLEHEIALLKIMFVRCCVAEREYHQRRLAIEQQVRAELEEEAEITAEAARHFPLVETNAETEGGQRKRKVRRSRVDYVDRAMRLSAKIAHLVATAAQIRHLAAAPPGDIDTLQEIAAALDRIPLSKGAFNGRFTR